MNHSPVIYQAYQAYQDLTNPIRTVAQATAPLLDIPWPYLPEMLPAKLGWALCEMVGLAGLTHERPSFGIDFIENNGHTAAVTEEAVDATPFCTLLHFKKDTPTVQPRVLLLAPLSGHFATLLRGTARTLLRDHDVYMTDWHNGRDVPIEAGRFGIDDYFEHVMRFIEKMGPGTHVVAVCQPTVAAIAVAALMAEDDNIAQPASMTLMAGPVDTRINPTRVNTLAVGRTYEWFEKNLIAEVPRRHTGAGRLVYPGFLQIAAFMSMNLKRHASSFRDLYNYMVAGDLESARNLKAFYEEYFAVMDLPGDYFLETVRTIFQEYHLAEGRLHYRGRLVRPSAIKRTPLLTVEGEKDDICSIGQTLAAQDLCTGLRPYMKQHHMQAGVGHYGVFNGRRWENEIYPRLRDFIYSSESLLSTPTTIAA